MNISEIKFIDGAKYRDEAGIIWTVENNGLFRIKDSYVNTNEKFKQQIEDYYTILGIASREFEAL